MQGAKVGSNDEVLVMVSCSKGGGCVLRRIVVVLLSLETHFSFSPCQLSAMLTPAC